MDKYVAVLLSPSFPYEACVMQPTWPVPLLGAVDAGNSASLIHAQAKQGNGESVGSNKYSRHAQNCVLSHLK